MESSSGGSPTPNDDSLFYGATSIISPTIDALAGDDYINSGPGNDVVSGSIGDDILEDHGGND